MGIPGTIRTDLALTTYVNVSNSGNLSRWSVVPWRGRSMDGPKYGPGFEESFTFFPNDLKLVYILEII